MMQDIFLLIYGDERFDPHKWDWYGVGTDLESTLRAAKSKQLNQKARSDGWGAWWTILQPSLMAWAGLQLPNIPRTNRSEHRISQMSVGTVSPTKNS
jgi:hypothetical protein